MRGLVGTTMPSNLVLYNDANPVMGENPLISTTDFSPSSHHGHQEMKDASVCNLHLTSRIGEHQTVDRQAHSILQDVVITNQTFVLFGKFSWTS